MRSRKAEFMRIARKDPKKRERMLESQRKSYMNGGHVRQRSYNTKIRLERPFLWRARISNTRWHLDPPLTEEILREMWLKQNGKCALTGRSMNIEDADLDHIIPQSRGGLATLDNLRWTWRRANEAKGNMTDSEFLDLCRDVIARTDVLTSPVDPTE
jgi:5-methylcytosine-specific restriction endonuclease McrA